MYYQTIGGIIMKPEMKKIEAFMTEKDVNLFSYAAMSGDGVFEIEGD